MARTHFSLIPPAKYNYKPRKELKRQPKEHSEMWKEELFRDPRRTTQQQDILHLYLPSTEEGHPGLAFPDSQPSNTG